MKLNAIKKLFYMACGTHCALFEDSISVYKELICSIQPPIA